MTWESQHKYQESVQLVKTASYKADLMTIKTSQSECHINHGHGHCDNRYQSMSFKNEKPPISTVQEANRVKFQTSTRIQLYEKLGREYDLLRGKHDQ